MIHNESDVILVTGATGFTGGHLMERLLAEGQPCLRALVRDKTRAQHLADKGVELVEGDLRDKASIERAMRGVDIVYNIAANFRAENVSDEDMWAINRDGVRYMLDAAEAEGVKRFVHCSTGGVHGNIENPPATEETPFNPGDYYQRSKLAGEQIAQQYIKEERLPITVFRPAGIYGAGDLRFVKLFKPIQNGQFFMIGDGKTVFHMVYVTDLVEGIVRCGSVDAAVGQTYLIAGESHVELNELVRTVADIVDGSILPFKVPFWPIYYAGYAMEIVCGPLGIQPPLYRRRVDFFRKNRWFDDSKAHDELGYQPKVSLREGLERTAQSYRELGHIS